MSQRSTITNNLATKWPAKWKAQAATVFVAERDLLAANVSKKPQHWAAAIGLRGEYWTEYGRIVMYATGKTPGEALGACKDKFNALLLDLFAENNDGDVQGACRAVMGDS